MTASALNPWPCERCSAPIAIAKRAGMVPRTTWLVLAVAATVAIAGVNHPYRGAGAMFWPMVAALVLFAALDLRLATNAAWRCARCGWRGRARRRCSGDPTLAVAIPTYNNAGSIADVVTRCIAAAPHLPLYVIDDGSKDGTGELAQKAIDAAPPAAGISRVVLRHPRNQGKGAALRTALAHALGQGISHLITLDGDGQHLPEDLPLMKYAVNGDREAIIVGSRDLSGPNVPGSSRFGNAFSNFWLRVQTGRKLLDSQSGFRVYPTAPVLSLGLTAKRYDYEVEVLTVGARAGLRLRSIPIGVHYPVASERVSHFDKTWDNVRISLINTRLVCAAPLWPLGHPRLLDGGDPPSNVARAWTGKSRGGAFGHLFFIWMLRLLGSKPAYLFLYPVSAYFLLFARGALKHTRVFLDRLIGPGGFVENEKRQYLTTLIFSRCILDRAMVSIIGGHKFTYSNEGIENIKSRGGKGGILLSAHLGNYELGGALLGPKLEGVNLHVVMLDSEAEAIRKVHARLPPTAHMPQIIAINKADFPALQILRVLRQGDLVAMHGDRIIDDHWAWCDFLGTKAPFPTGVFAIAATARVPVVLTFGFHEGEGKYRFLAEPPRDIELPRERREQALAEHAQWYASRLEYYARQYPLQWFNFYDFWKAPSVQATR